MPALNFIGKNNIDKHVIGKLAASFSIIPLLLITLLTSTQLAAIPVEAEGSAMIGTQSIEAARAEAISNASQQALLQAGAYISATQSMSQGVLNIDNVRIRSNGSITNVEVIDERVSGNLFIVKIRAEVETEDSCDAGNANYIKTAAVTGFVLEHPLQANLGDLHNAQSLISKRLSQDLTAIGNLQAMNASHLRSFKNLSTAASYQQPQGNMSQNLASFAELDVQFVVSGIIRDLRKYDPSRSSEGNYFTGLYDKADYRGQQHMRNFAVEVYVHDGFTGAQLFNKQYRTAGLWRLDDHVKTGFASAAFLQTDYGQQVNKLLGEISKDINKDIRCEPFRARILQAQGNLVTFNAGTLAGLRPGDKLTVYRKSTFYDQMQQPHTRLENTRRTLVVNEVHPQFGIGRIDADAEQQNIQQDDVLLAW